MALLSEPGAAPLASRWDRAILTQGLVAPRSCSEGYTALAASRPGAKSPRSRHVGKYQIGSNFARQIEFSHGLPFA